MSPRRPPRRRSFVLPLLVVLVAIVAAVGWAWSAGHVELPFLEREKAPLAEGMIRVPASVRTIPAYTKVTRDDLIDPRTKEIFTVTVPAAVADEVGLKRTIGEIIGRVTDADKTAGYAFLESNFLEKGTREGLVGGIPEGMLGVTVEVDKIAGLHKLRPGDRFYIAEAVTVETSEFGAIGDRDRGALDQLVTRANASGLKKQAAVRIIVENGIVVTPVETRVKSDTKRGLTSTTTSRQQIEEVTIAVDAESVTRLIAALEIDAAVICIARSGDPRAAPDADRASDHEVWTPFDDLGPKGASKPSGDGSGDGKGEKDDSIRFVERVIGGETRLVPVPRSDGDP